MPDNLKGASVSVDVPDDWIEDGASGETEAPDPAAVQDESENAEPAPDRMTRDEFRAWYAQRFFLVNMGLAPFVGGPLESLNVSASAPSLIAAADGLYDLAERKGWDRLLRRSAGAFSLIESHLMLGYEVVTGVASEISARRAAAQTANGDRSAVNAEEQRDGAEPGFVRRTD